jgi:hypothetical protein
LVHQLQIGSLQPSPVHQTFRYVDNRLIFGDARPKDLTPYEVLLDEGLWKTYHPGD